MKVIEIGNFFETTHSIKYLSNRTFIGFDMVIIDMNYMLDGVYQREFAVYEKRLESLVEYISHYGIPIVVFAPTFKTLITNNGNRQVDVCKFLPGPDFLIENEEGHEFEIIKGTIFSEFLSKYKLHFAYQSYFTSYNGTPLINTPTKKMLSFYNDNVVFLPKIKSSIKKTELEFFEDVYSVLCKLKRNNLPIEIPDWANGYYLPEEKGLVLELTKLKREKELLEKKILELEEIRVGYHNQKIVFSGYGNSLELELKKMFEEIGFEIIESEPGRSDITIKYGERVAVVEVKGVKGTAAEKNSAQLEKWKILYSEKFNTEPKGILIVNSHRDTELSQRQSITFPHQMLRYAENRDQCLLTTLQFLGIYYNVKKNGIQEELINSLFNTIGIYNGFEKWQDYIEQ